MELTLTVILRRQFEAGVAAALIGAPRVHADAVVADVWITGTLVNIDTRVSGGRQREPLVAKTLETALKKIAGYKKKHWKLP